MVDEIYLNEEEEADLKAAWSEIREEQRAKSPPAAEAVDSDQAPSQGTDADAVRVQTGKR